MSFHRVSTWWLDTPWRSNMQQKVTVPALSSTSLDLPLSILSLLYSSALLFCQLYFPYLPPESAYFFSPLPLSFFPSPTTLYHWLTITVSVDMCICASLIICGLHPILSWPSNSLNVGCARGAMGNGGGVSYLQELWQKLLCCLCCCVAFAASPQIKAQQWKNIMLLPGARDLFPTWEHGFRTQTLENSPMSVWLKREARMCRRGWTGDEEFDRGLSCSSSVERNVAVMSQIQEGACLLMTQSPQPQAPPPQSPHPSLWSASVFMQHECQINQ